MFLPKYGIKLCFPPRLYAHGAPWTLVSKSLTTGKGGESIDHEKSYFFCSSGNFLVSSLAVHFIGSVIFLATFFGGTAVGSDGINKQIQ